MWGWLRTKVEVVPEPSFREMLEQERERLARRAEEREARLAAWHESFAAEHRANVLRKVRGGRRRLRWSVRSTASPVLPRTPREVALLEALQAAQAQIGQQYPGHNTKGTP